MRPSGAIRPCVVDVLSVTRSWFRVLQSNLKVYGADKVWRQLHREGQPMARCTVDRLMRRNGLRGVMRDKVVRTTINGPKTPCPLDRVNRQFKADRPNQLWVSGFTLECCSVALDLGMVRSTDARTARDV